MPKIPIKIKTLRSVPYKKLKPFQGNLKEMSVEAADKLKASLLKYGWRFPVFVWKHKGTEWIHDGHGRLLVLKELIKEGYTIDDLPVVDIEARDKREAGELLLALNSRYQRTTEEGLYEFMHEMDITLDDLTGFELPEIDLDDFRESYFEDIELPSLPDGDKAPFQQITFTLHDKQAEEIKDALATSKGLGPFVGPNENSNGNALARICKRFLEAHGTS